MLGRGLRRSIGISLRAFAQGSRVVAREDAVIRNGPVACSKKAHSAFSQTSARFFFNDQRGGYVHFQRRKSGVHISRQYLLLGTGAVGVYVYATHLEEVPYTHRRHFVLISPETEKAIGVEQFKKGEAVRQVKAEAEARSKLLPPHPPASLISAISPSDSPVFCRENAANEQGEAPRQVKAEAEAQGKLLAPDHPASASVRRIGRRLAAKAVDEAGGGRYSHMKDLEWEFVVIDEPDTTNAFVMPGGKVVVYTGLLKLLRTEKEVASVLGHEIAHVLGRHIGEKLSTNVVLMVTLILAAFALGINIPADLVQLAVELPNSRKLETEADIIGLHISARACYDPAAAIITFTKLGEMERRMGVRIPKFLRTHPLSEERVKAIEKNLPSALQDYELAGCNAPRQFFSWPGEGGWR